MLLLFVCSFLPQAFVIFFLNDSLYKNKRRSLVENEIRNHEIFGNP